MITKNQIKALKILEQIPKTVNWAIIGSANLAIQGINVTPKDIDILTDKDGAHKIEKALKKYISKPIELKKYEKYDTYEVIFKIHGVEVEVLGDLKNKIPGVDLWTERSRLSAKIFVEFNDIKLPVINLKQELFAYIKRNRKDKSALIKKFLERLD